MSGKMDSQKPRVEGKPGKKQEATEAQQPGVAAAKGPAKGPNKEPNKEPSKEPNKEPSKEPNKEPSKEPNKEPAKGPSKEQLLQRERSDSEETEEEPEETPVEAAVESQPAASLELKSISSKNSFDKCLKLAGDRLVVFFFTGSWCDTCHLFKPYVRDLAQLNLELVDFYEVNVDDSEDTAEACEIDHLPTFLLYKKEKRLAEVCDDSRVTLEAKITEFK